MDIAAVSTISIHVERPYDTRIEAGILRHAGDLMRERLGEGTRAFVVSVAPVLKHWGSVLAQSLESAKVVHHVIEMRDGERYKTLDTIADLADKMVRRGADRKSVIVAFGGGVVGDVAGFLASVYMRGIDFVQIPTTVVAQVDASIGGKTGVDLKVGKNLLGTFHHPRMVITDPSVLSTLPERDYRSGLFEALKCGIIASADLFRYMEENRDRILARDAEALHYVITEAVRIKTAIVEEDERETGRRRVLNLGHTIGHALEAETAYKQFLHGEAVAWGMVASAMISAAMQRCDGETARRIISTIIAYTSLPKVEPRGKKLVKRLSFDKKTTNGIQHFVLPNEIGKVEIASDVPERAVIQAVEELRYLSLAP